MFLNKLAQYIKEKDYNFSELTIVVPSERIRKYLWKELYEVYQKPLVSPEVLTMNQLVKKSTSKTILDKTRILIELFKIQLEDVKSEEDKSFDEFITWGEILISDFNEIDLYHLDSTQVFKNLADIKELESWQVDADELTASQKRFLEFWDRLPSYYEKLQKKLIENNTTYSGLAYKELANNIDRLFVKKKEMNFIFAGFNALSQSEKDIVRQLERMGRAEVIIDADKYYLDDNKHEAGSFLRDVKKYLDVKTLPFEEDSLVTKSMNIEIVECAQTSGQAKVAATILDGLTKEQIEETLLLLADESLINAVVNNLPKNINKANITLGLPIKSTAVKTWVELLFSIQENKTRFKTTAMYHVDLLKLWNHPFVVSILSQDEIKSNQKIEDSIIRNNRIFINADKLELGAKMRSIVDLVSQVWNSNWTIALENYRSLNKVIYSNLGEDRSYEKSLIECFDKSLIDFNNIIVEGLPQMSLRSFRHLFNQHWSKQSVAYHGNPIDGLQIMGLLETRGLDFKRIICLGMNEGKLPPTNPIQTFIPMDLRRYLQLPTPRQKQGIFAHHFYRTLHGCEDLVITYSSAEDVLNGAEPSRYILQLEKELSRRNTNVSIKRSVYTIDNVHEQHTIEIKKTDKIVQRLDELFARSSSPSMLKTYIKCPLDFYFKYVMEFGEADEIEEDIENSTFGTFIHATLEELYTPFAHFTKDGEEVKPTPRPIKSTDVEQMIKEFEKPLTEQFMKHFNGDRDAFTKGKNYLSYRMAHDLVKSYLKSEVEFLSQQSEPVNILSLERKYNAKIDVDVYGVKKLVNLVGYIDRIDKVGEKVRVVDYKSGVVRPGDVKYLGSRSKVEDKELGSIQNSKHVLQLLQYAFMYYNEHNVIPESSIVSFVSNQFQPFILDTDKFEIEDQVKKFPTFIGMLLEEIYDPEHPFVHADEYFSYCKYCE